MKKLQLPNGYSLNREYCGYKNKFYVLRYYGDFVNSFEYKENAINHAIKLDKEKYPERY